MFIITQGLQSCPKYHHQLISILLFCLMFIVEGRNHSVETNKTTSSFVRYNVSDENQKHPSTEQTSKKSDRKKTTKKTISSLLPPDNSNARAQIIGGIKTNPHRFPYIVSILNASEGPTPKIICGASLIAPNVVLTAAHCFEQHRAEYIQIGRYNQTDPTESFENFPITNYHLHPDFIPFQFLFDVAVIRLPNKSRFPPVTLFQRTDDASLTWGESLTILGWGTTSYATFNGTSSILREVDVNLVDQSECNQKFGSLFRASTMICAMNHGKDACSGDSGGPLIRKHSSDDDDDDVDPTMDVQVGIISWGYECADPYFPGVYTRLDVNVVRDFVDGVLCDQSPDDCPIEGERKKFKTKAKQKKGKAKAKGKRKETPQPSPKLEMKKGIKNVKRKRKRKKNKGDEN